MGIFEGIVYHFRGLRLALGSPKLLFLGIVRFLVIILITIFAIGAVLYFHQDILTLIWSQPDSRWLLWLWYLVSWLLSAVLVGISAVLSYLLAQILFAVVIMDQMSRITENKVTGQVRKPQTMTWLQEFFFLVKQELPRAVLPIIFSLGLTLVAWLTPLGPIVSVLTTATVIVLLSWDNTDLIPARRMQPFRHRVRLLFRNLLFHLGFGLVFLVPLLNIVFLSFAPVGATLYYLDRHDRAP